MPKEKSRPDARFDDVEDPLDLLSNLGEDVSASQQALFVHPELEGRPERTPGAGPEIR